MKQPHFLLRMAAVVTSVLLAGGFVAYRAGAIPWLSGKRERPATSESKPIPAEKMFSSTKSGVISPPGLVDDSPPPAPTQSPPIIMSGSKSQLPFPDAVWFQ